MNGIGGGHPSLAPANVDVTLQTRTLGAPGAVGTAHYRPPRGLKCRAGWAAS